jgi:fluoride exporter
MLSSTGLSLVAAGSAAGGMLRFWLGLVIDRHLAGRLPWGTIAVNLSGALLVGLLVAPLALFGDGGPSLPTTFLVTGFLGSYTTVSAFGLQTMIMVRQGQVRKAILHAVLSVIGCLLGAVTGLQLGRLLFGGVPAA